MKLLMITGDRSLAQGKQGAFWNTLAELHKHWERIDVICPHVRPHRYDMALFGNVYVHPSPWPLVFQWLWAWHKGRHLVREYGHDIATVHEYAPVFNGVGARLLKRAAGIPYVLEIMHVTGLPRAGNPWEAFNRWLLRTFIAWEVRPAAAVRTINAHEVPDFLVSAGVPRSKLIHVPAFYIDLETFRPLGEPKHFDLVFVGRLARNKGLGLFLDVAKRLDARALVVGEGPLRKWAMDRARNERISVKFHGFASGPPEVASLMNQSRLLVMPSYSEGGPRVVLEALACGTPVLATPVGIVTDILPPEAVEEWDASALADKARNILSDDALYVRLREAGLLTALKYERSAAIKNYAEALKRIIAAR